MWVQWILSHFAVFQHTHCYFNVTQRLQHTLQIRLDKRHITCNTEVQHHVNADTTTKNFSVHWMINFTLADCEKCWQSWRIFWSKSLQIHQIFNQLQWISFWNYFTNIPSHHCKDQTVTCEILTLSDAKALIWCRYVPIMGMKYKIIKHATIQMLLLLLLLLLSGCSITALLTW